MLLSLADTSTSSPNKGWFCVEGRDRRVSLRPGQPRAWISVRALGPKGSLWLNSCDLVCLCFHERLS